MIGVPCNQFGRQEPGSNAEILAFAQSKYSVTFPMVEKVDVKGPDATPLYTWLTQQAPHSDGSTDVRWNFEKFLVDRHGNVVRRYATKVTPEALAPDVEAQLERA